MAKANRKIRDHNRPARDLYHVIENTLPLTAFRGQVAGSKTVHLGEVMAEQQNEKRAARSDRDDLDAQIVRAARRAGKSAAPVPRTRQALEGLEMLAEAKADTGREDFEEESIWNESEHFADPNAIEAKIAVELPGTVGASELPKELQFMPPGRHTIHASRGGKPAKLDVNVTEAGAHRVVAQHAE